MRRRRNVSVFLPWSQSHDMQSLPTRQARHKHTNTTAQFDRYKSLILTGQPSLHSLLKYKRSTAIDMAISLAPAKMARRYIKVRLQVLTMPPGLTCPLCPVTYAPIQHALWHCPAQTLTRETLISNVALRSEHAATDPSLWHALQTLFIQYIWDITEKLCAHQQTNQS